MVHSAGCGVCVDSMAEAGPSCEELVGQEEAERGVAQLW